MPPSSFALSRVLSGAFALCVIIGVLTFVEITMKIAVTLSLITCTSAFLGPLPVHERTTSLFAESSRRDALLNVVRGSGFVLGTVMAPKV